MHLEKLNRRRITLAAAISAGALGLAACGPNYSGNGNDFVVQGKVTDPGSHSLKADIFEIDEAEGSADGWFNVGTVHQLHDNCNCHGTFESGKQYGHVYDAEGDVIPPSDVAVGSCVKFIGTIRASYESKYSSPSRPVYTTAQIEECPN